MWRQLLIGGSSPAGAANPVPSGVQDVARRDLHVIQKDAQARRTIGGIAGCLDAEIHTLTDGEVGSIGRHDADDRGGVRRDGAPDEQDDEDGADRAEDSWPAHGSVTVSTDASERAVLAVALPPITQLDGESRSPGRRGPASGVGPGEQRQLGLVAHRLAAIR